MRITLPQGAGEQTMTTTTMPIQTDDAPLDLADMRRRIRAIFIGSIGNLVEWYDFYAYAAFALYFAAAFFPNSDPVVQQLNAALLFAAGFLVRPLGGWLFGYLADHRGRRGALMLSVSLMCFGSLMIAVTPTYASIGIYAPILLAAARIIQGLSLGGEYGTSATYLTEMADQRHRGFYSSFQYVTLIGGQICALLVLLVLQKVFLTGEEIRAWGWRIPFFIGALLALIALVMRRTLQETDAFEAAKQVVKRTSSLRALMKYPREVLLVVGLTAGGTAAFYTYTTYMLYAEIFKALGRPYRRSDHDGDVERAHLRHDPAADLWRDLGPHRAEVAAHRLRRHGRIVHHPAAHDLAVRQRPVCRIPVDRGGVDDRVGLHVDQRGGESRIVSHQYPRHRRRAALCADGFDLRRHHRLGSAVVQVDRPRSLVLLLPDRHDRHFALGLSVHARHQGRFGDASA